MKNKLLLILILFTNTVFFAQFSKTHYIPPISASDAQVPTSQSLYISCPSTTPVNFRINVLGGGIINGVVSRDLPYVLNVGSDTSTQMLVAQNNVSSVISNKGYIIEAEDMIYATFRYSAMFHAGSIVSKGLAALGTRFRIGGFLNLLGPTYTNSNFTFASILATENNTTVSFNDINSGVSLVNNAGEGNTPASISLNSGESYVIAVQGPNNANKDGLIGALITSDKPIAVNCGSVAGNNNNTSNLDFGTDQIVSAERTGKEYILIKGGSNSIPNIESPIIIADENNTEVFLNGNASPTATLQAGEYLNLTGNEYSANGSIYIRTSKNVFVYQVIGGSENPANQNMHFVPPLTCETPKIVNNIPLINTVSGDPSFLGTVLIVTETGATLSFILNGTNYTTATLPAGVTITGPSAVNGNTAYVTYRVNGLTGNVSVISTKQVYVSYFGTSGAATYGGFYSGFTFKPEIVQDIVAVGQTNCIPNAKLSVTLTGSFDQFQWYFNDVLIPGATSNEYFPTMPGYYNVQATISACGSTLISDKIPVSTCPTNLDNDAVNDNVDIDLDNDGITNCNEGIGNSTIDTSLTNGTITNTTTTYTRVFNTSNPAATIPFVGNVNGNIITEVLPGKGYFVENVYNFSAPTSIKIDYPEIANASDLMNSNAEYIVNSDVNKTITVLNPTNQLLIDTNYDGIYESGITSYSSFEIRFRLNSTTPLAQNTGTFSFLSNLATTIKITHKNLLNTAGNKSTFRIIATCIPIDTDNDGIVNASDYDSDNDGILDNFELTSQNYLPPTGIDTDLDGLDNAYETTIIAVDSDNDGIKDMLDLDSDNDGIYDVFESGSSALDANLDGMVDGNPASFGINGLSNSLENTVDNGQVNYTIANTNLPTDTLPNFISLDSDGDGCFDVIEAAFTGNYNSNNDGILGGLTPPTVNASGIVTSINGGSGYLNPNANYITFAPIIITTQPTITPTCEFQNTSFTLVDNGGNTYQWQLSIDGGTIWSDITNNATYAGSTTNTLSLTNITGSMNNYQYRVQLDKVGNSCGLDSASATLTVLALPVVTTPILFRQCDVDLDLVASFNLEDITEVKSKISTNYANETFTYYRTLAGAQTADTSPAVFITNPIAFTNTTLGFMSVWARVVNTNGCFITAQINLQVIASSIPNTYSFTIPPVCDDNLDNDPTNPLSVDVNRRDGVSLIDFSAAENTPITGIRAQLPAGNYTIKYYRNLADANANQNEITNTSTYRNIGYPDNQDIYVRVTNDLDSGCFGLGPFIKLSVERLPFANPVVIPRQCDDNHDGIFTFNTLALESTLLGSQTNKTVTYFDANNVALPSPFPATFTTTSQIIKARVTNNSALACIDETTIEFIVDDKSEAFPVTNVITTLCDEEADPSLQDGIQTFNTTSLESDLLGTQTNTTVAYFDAAGNPLLSSTGTPIVSPFPASFITATQTIRAVLTNTFIVGGTTVNTCTDFRDITFTVNPVPKINLTGSELVCTNLPTFTVSVDAGITDGSPITDYTYEWSLNGTPISPAETNYTLITNQEGEFTVKVTNANNCYRTRTITIVASDIATILPPTITELTDNNTITVNTEGTGDYVYSLDEEFGPFQEDNIFTNVTAGIHILYVKDKNGCGTSKKEIYVLGIPKYFTPNGDGYHDFWNVRGVTSVNQPNTKVFIFDRFGKLIKQMSPLEQGWNGTFNGAPVPSDDYWYTVEFQDGRNIKGNFSLKR